MFDSLQNKLGNAYRGIVTSVSSVINYFNLLKTSNESHFFDKGTLTPQEFIIAGDQLTKACPAWQWKCAANKNYENDKLPADKQFLITIAQSSKRVKDLLADNTKETNIDEEWVINECSIEKEQEEQNFNLKNIKMDYINVKNIEKKDENKEKIEKKIEKKEEKEEKIEVKKEEKIEEKIEEKEEKNKENKEKKKEEEEEEKIDEKEEKMIKIEEPDELEDMRSYNLSITYDFYYLTPRLFITGVDMHNKPLTNDQIFEDIMAEFANKTVTFENHPHLGVLQASIHPCKHSDVMKHLIDMIQENGAKIGVHQALFVFLKFMASVMPTVEYDFTVDIFLG